MTTPSPVTVDLMLRARFTVGGQIPEGLTMVSVEAKPAVERKTKAKAGQVSK